MITKTFEIRDEGTFIPVVAVQIRAEKTKLEDHRIFKRAGFSGQPSFTIITNLNSMTTEYDPNKWNQGRTMAVAHKYIQTMFNDLVSGCVIDVQYILGETKEIKKSDL